MPMVCHIYDQAYCIILDMVRAGFSHSNVTFHHCAVGFLTYSKAPNLHRIPGGTPNDFTAAGPELSFSSERGWKSTRGIHPPPCPPSSFPNQELKYPLLDGVQEPLTRALSLPHQPPWVGGGSDPDGGWWVPISHGGLSSSFPSPHPHQQPPTPPLLSFSIKVKAML